jgi:hypothetical protein
MQGEMRKGCKIKEKYSGFFHFSPNREAIFFTLTTSSDLATYFSGSSKMFKKASTVRDFTSRSAFPLTEISFLHSHDACTKRS